MADTVHSPVQGKPYFSLAMKKVTTTSPIDVSEAVESLQDSSILGSMVSVDPLEITNTVIIEVDVEESETTSTTVTTQTQT